MERIVSLEPSVTATLIALGQRDRLVGVSRFCHRLADVAGIAELDVTWSLDAEAVAALKPDLVIASTPYRAGKIDELLKSHLNVLCLYPQTLADIYRHIGWIGALCGRPDQAAQVIQEMQATFDQLRRLAPPGRQPRVYVEMWPPPAMMNSIAWVAEIVAKLGGLPVPQPPGRQVSRDEIVAADPEVIVLAWAGVERIDPAQVSGRSGWERVAAVREGRVVAIDEILVNAPGPNLAAGARELFRALYPDAPG